ncbi:MAG: hypothetical protein RBU30_01530 [Polyangia bacterium]|nr:hypothetical protein [Polyangia bacterium]
MTKGEDKSSGLASKSEAGASAASVSESAAKGGRQDRTTSPTGWRRPELRRRLALLVLVLGMAVVVAYWSRGRPVELEVIYDFGPNASRVARIEISYELKGKGSQPVEMDFPSSDGAPRRWRHTMSLTPGDYLVRARVHLRAGPGGEAEVKSYSRQVTVKSGEGQRLVLRLAR